MQPQDWQKQTTDFKATARWQTGISSVSKKLHYRVKRPFRILMMRMPFQETIWQIYTYAHLACRCYPVSIAAEAFVASRDSGFWEIQSAMHVLALLSYRSYIRMEISPFSPFDIPNTKRNLSLLSLFGVQFNAHSRMSDVGSCTIVREHADGNKNGSKQNKWAEFRGET